MSKAFTKESDSEEEAALSRVTTLPNGARNYMTADGAERLRKQLETLVDQRTRLAEAGEGEIRRDELRRITAQVQVIAQKLADADVVALSEANSGEVRFGMFVTLRDGDGAEDEYRIVGVDEVDFEPGWISWLSPLARAVMGKRVGEVVQFHAPVGEKMLHILAVRSPVAGSAG